ncbi:hypothetical protein PV963_40395 [Streptomyces coeruleorubidus]|uniref:hypothetical protein n=1 Tax=Streptomyces coeruleorubidus TaxID=116188 RepID=UPI00237F4DFC|nr:hypothetical protein [Streptomyces coeruleorubidus]WDV56155.1 hypothetical protein PV963_40395 [Streptomyces coeruleorubidus]
MRLRRLMPCAVLAACLTGCGGVDGGVRAEGPAATTIPWTGPVYMADWYGRAWQRPEEVSATLRLSLSELRWQDWGSPRARATGVATDDTCLSGCPDGNENPPNYQVKIVLSDPVRRGDVAFYSQATLTPVHPPAPFWAEGHDSIDLDVPDA